jgi:hypothetical protein
VEKSIFREAEGIFESIRRKIEVGKFVRRNRKGFRSSISSISGWRGGRGSGFVVVVKK